MFVLSFGMQKSASLLLTRFAIDLLATAAPATGQAAFEALIADGTIPGVGCFPWEGWEHRADLLSNLAAEHGPFVVKSHGPLTGPVERLIAAGGRPLCSVRDPRDVLLSLIDHGAANRAAGGGVFTEHTEVADTLPKLMEICVCAHTWLQSGLPCVFRYRDLVAQPAVEIARLAGFLGLRVGEEEIAAIIDRERRTRKKGKDCFNTGLPTRFRAEMSPEDIARCNQTLGFYIESLGYALG